MIKISVVIITLNEERNIGRCIDSVSEIADDIVIVDSYSADRTTEIARSKGARVIEHTFGGHIEQKNYAITQALYPHILSLDADEALSEELIASIRSIKASWRCDGYEMNRLTSYCGKWIRHSGWYPDRKLRLWDSRMGHWGGINPHDKYIMDSGSSILRLKGDIFHYSYYSVEDHLKQIDKFSSIAADAYYRRNRKNTFLLMLLSPFAAFLRQYFINLGFLDGHYGFIICRNCAYEKRLKYKKLRGIYHRERLNKSCK